MTRFGMTIGPRVPDRSTEIWTRRKSGRQGQTWNIHFYISFLLTEHGTPSHREKFEQSLTFRRYSLIRRAAKYASQRAIGRGAEVISRFGQTSCGQIASPNKRAISHFSPLNRIIMMKKATQPRLLRGCSRRRGDRNERSRGRKFGMVQRQVTASRSRLPSGTRR